MPDGAEGPADARALTVQAPTGAVDLVCPATASVADVARACAARLGLPTMPLLYARTGQPLPVGATMAELGVVTGSVLVAATAVVRCAAVLGDHGHDEPLGFEGGERRRGRRRRHVVSARDGAGSGRVVGRGRHGG